MNVSGVIRVSLFYLLILLTGCSLPDGGSVEKLAESSLNQIQIQTLYYNQTDVTLNIKAEIPASSFYSSNQVNTVKIFGSSTCTTNELANGLSDQMLTQGLNVTVPIATLTPLYFWINSSNKCLHIEDYKFSVKQVKIPAFSKFEPSTPTSQTFQPLIFGEIPKFTQVRFYSDSPCTSLVGQGEQDVFHLSGIRITLNSNNSTDIYAKTIDIFNNSSNCVKLSQFTHTTVRPDNPLFVTSLPLSPSYLSTTPKIKGLASANTLSVKLFSDSSCAVILAEGSKDEFNNDGLTINVTENSTTNVYAKTYATLDLTSDCVLLTRYIHDIIPPGNVSYLYSNPSTPTRLTRYPKIVGTATDDTAVVRFYKEPLCLVSSNIGFGSKNDFNSNGIVIGVDENSLTSIYGKAFDSAGNGSSCIFLVNYKHNTIPPDPPIFSHTFPTSPNNQSSTPKIFGTTSSTATNVFFYSNEACTSLIGSDTATNYMENGVELITANIPNEVNDTSIFGTAKDEEGNISECSLVTNYRYSTAKAKLPVFFQSVPTSPSSYSTTPWILGSSDKSLISISLYSDNSCQNLLGSSTKSVFATAGIKVELLSNVKSSIYVISRDEFGNDSDCAKLTEYTHDNQPPEAPVFVATNPISPNRVSSTPSITGTVSMGYLGKPLPTSAIKFYDSLLCLSELGTGVPNDFSSAGINISVATNAITQLYAKAIDLAGNSSTCSFMTSYTHSNRSPGNPVFVSALPASPSFDKNTNMSGTIGASQDILPPTEIKIYQDSLCSQLISQGTASQFTTGGISTVVPVNQETALFAKTFDAVGSQSTCQKLTDFLHSSVAPQGLQISQNTNGSVSLMWLPNMIANPSPHYIVKRSMKSGGPYTIVAWDNIGTQFVDREVAHGKKYYYVVAATNNTGASSNSSEISITINSSSVVNPLSLVASAGSKYVELQWQGFSPNMYYKVMRSTTSGGPYTLIFDRLLSTAAIDSNLTNNQNYYYRVSAINPQGESLLSNEASAQPTAVSSAPTNLNFRLYNSWPDCPSQGKAVILNWTSPSHYNQFVVGRGLNSGQLTEIATVTSNKYIDCTPPDGFTDNSDLHLYYAVKAQWGSGAKIVKSSYSNEVAIYYDNSIGVSVLPGDQHIKLEWTAPNAKALTYQIWRSAKTGWPSNTSDDLTGAGYTQLQSSFSGNVYIDSGLTNDQAYYYVVIANYQYGIGFPSPEESGIPRGVPSTPVNLKVMTDTTNIGGVDLEWSAPGHYNFFRIYRASASNPTYVFIGNSSSASFTDSPSSPNLYYYYVTAVWGTYETTASNIVNYRFGYPLTTTLTASSTSLTLAFGAVTGALGHKILRASQLDGPYTEIANVTSSPFINSTSSPGSYPVVANTAYFYQIQAYFSDGSFGQKTNAVSGQLTGGSNTVNGLAVTDTNASSVSLSWVAPTTGSINYRIYRSTTLNGTYTNVGTTLSRFYTVNSLSSNIKYYFKVAVSSCALSCLSDAVSGITVNKPSAPIADGGISQVKLAWNTVNGATAYELLRSTDGVNFSVLQSGTFANPFFDTTVTDYQLYFYKLRITLSDGSTKESNSSVGVTPHILPLSPPKISIVSNLNGTDVGLEWAKVAGATGYRVYLSSTSGGPWGSPALNTSSNTGNILIGLTAGQQYYAVLTTLNGINESSFSSEISFIPDVEVGIPQIKVNQVSNQTGIEISWTSVTNAASYDILKSTDGFYFTKLQDHQNILSYFDTSVVTNVSYYYKIISYSASGAVMASSGIAGPININATLPASQLKIVVKSDLASAVLSWTMAASLQTSSYQILRSSTSGSGYTVLSTVPATTNSFEDTTILPANTYYYVVKALNNYGMESNPSNEVLISVNPGPQNLQVNSINKQIQLSWDNDVNAVNGYKIYKSNTSQGPYYELASLASGTLSFSDLLIENNVTYYYVVQSQLAGGLVSAYSNEVNALGILQMNLSFPVELVDMALGSSNTGDDIVFERTRTSLDTSDYDGTVNYEFEIVASNSSLDSVNVELVDENSTSVALLTIPSQVNQSTRYSVGFSPTAGDHQYRIKVIGTNPSGAVSIFAGRLWVKQTNATKTKIYIPLTNSGQSAMSGDLYAPIEAIQANQYTLLQNSSYYQRRINQFKNLIYYNPFEFEAVVGAYNSQGLIGLYNNNTAQIVDQTETQIQDLGPHLIKSSFSEESLGFKAENENQFYKVALKCTWNCNAGSVRIYKAGLWVSLQNLQLVELHIRTQLQAQNLNSTASFLNQRVMINLSEYSNPIVNFKATAKVDPAMGGGGGPGSIDVQLMSAGSSDSESVLLSPIFGSLLQFTQSNYEIKSTSSPIIINSTERFVPQLQYNSGNQSTVLDSFIVIKSSP